MSANVIPIDPVERRVRRRLEADMVAEVERRWAEALRDVAELGGVSVEYLNDLVVGHAEEQLS